jgi:hypothetical protein
MKKWVWLSALIITTGLIVLVVLFSGGKRTIRSRILEEKRPLLVHLPPGYRESTTSFPVLYILDASNSGFRFGMNIVPGGGHVPKSSLYDGLRFYFSPQ